MNIVVDKSAEQEKIILTLSGRLDTYSFIDTEKEILQAIHDNSKVILDFAKVTYISSEGLRALLNSQKLANDIQVEMILRDVQNDVMKIFRMTGFINFLTLIKG